MKIKIPWYRRNINVKSFDETENTPLNIDLPKIPNPPSGGRGGKPQLEFDPVRVKEPATVTVKEPALNPEIEPNPLDKLFPQDDPFGKEFPLPIPIPPLRNPNENDNALRNPQPQALIKKNPVTQALETALTPMLLFILGKEILNNYVEAKITNPIYNKMLQDPVLGLALREAEKSNLDMQAVANYFANYDYSSFDANQMTKELTTLFGAAAAVRLVVFFIGRKVVFKI